MKSALSKQVVRDQHGLSTLEYVILFVIIVVGALTLWSKLGGELSDDLDDGAGTFDKPESVYEATPTPTPPTQLTR
jgi:Flp pilus assembly pilin Flp